MTSKEFDSLNEKINKVIEQLRLDGVNAKNVGAIIQQIKFEQARTDELEKRVVAQDKTIQTLSGQLADIKQQYFLMQARLSNGGSTA